LGWAGGGGAKEAAAARRGWAGGGAKEAAAARRVGARVRICFWLIPCREIMGDCTAPIGPAVTYIYRRHTDYKPWRTKKLPRKLIQICISQQLHNNNSQNVQARLYLERAERVGVVEGCCRWWRLVGHLGGDHGRLGAVPTSGHSGKGEVWMCGVEGSGGAPAMGCYGGAATTARLGVQRRRGVWLCLGLEVEVGRWRRRFFCVVIFSSTNVSA
jgi:hypothetical protein